jgi:hypothetical protein
VYIIMYIYFLCPSYTALKMKQIDNIMDDPIDDAEMKSLLGSDAKIIRYSDLKRFHDIHDLLPKDTDFAVILYQTEPTVGHWVAVLKYPHQFGRSVIEYFDPYGKSVDEPLAWISQKKAIQMGINAPFLSQMLANTTNEKLLENKIEYQHESPKIETCGRHVIYRILQLVNHGMNQSNYNAHMRNLKSRNKKLSYDEIVSSVISI